jgi:hypothetical protein
VLLTGSAAEEPPLSAERHREESVAHLTLAPALGPTSVTSPGWKRRARGWCLGEAADTRLTGPLVISHRSYFFTVAPCLVAVEVFGCVSHGNNSLDRFDFIST